MLIAVSGNGEAVRMPLIIGVASGSPTIAEVKRARSSVEVVVLPQNPG